MRVSRKELMSLSSRERRKVLARMASPSAEVRQRRASRFASVLQAIHGFLRLGSAAR